MRENAEEKEVCVCVCLFVFLCVCSPQMYGGTHTQRQIALLFFFVLLQRGGWPNIKCCVFFYVLKCKPCCCSASVLRLMTECGLKRGTAPNLSLPQRWTQSQSSIATVRSKVCLYFFVISSTLYLVQIPLVNRTRVLRLLLCLTVASVCFCLWKLHLCVSVPPRLPLAVKCSLPGEPGDLLSGSTHSVSERI